MDFAAGKSLQPDLRQQTVDRLPRERLALLRGAEANIFRHCSGKEKCRLHHHAHPAAELGGRERAIVLAGEVNGSAGRLVKPIQQAQQRRFAGAARSDDGHDLAFGDLPG